MATDPPIPDPSEVLEATKQKAIESAAAIKGLTDAFYSFGERIKSSSSLTETQAAIFGTLSSAVLGASKTFQGAGSAIFSFSDQVKGAIAPIQNNREALQLFASKLGVVGSALKGSAIQLTELIMGMADSADAAMRTREQYLGLAAASGDLGDINALVGDRLQNLNSTIMRQGASLAETQKATHLTSVAIEGYYKLLGSIPQALTLVMDATDGSTQKTSLLTAAIKYSQGSHREMSDIVGDLTTAFNDYRLSGEDALLFTARMSELSSKFHINLSDVQSSLRSTADGFKMIGAGAEGAAKLVNDYVGALQSTGISGKTALGVVQEMTQGVLGLSIAQKAFLSSQTGGAGGLMGAFQIEKSLKEGKIDEVFEKVRKSMSRTMGPIVTLDEAAMSQQAAAQRTKQMVMLRQGPLGQFAKDDATASKMLDAFAARDRGTVSATGLSDTVLKDTIKLGDQYAEQNNTSLTRIQENTQALRTLGSFSNLGMIQQMFASGVGASTSGDTTAQKDMRAGLKATSVRAAGRTGEFTTEIEDAKSTKQLKDSMGAYAYQIIDDYKRFFDDLPAILQSPLDTIRTYLKSGDTKSAEEIRSRFDKSLAEQKEAAKTLAGASREKELKRLTEEQKKFDEGYSYLRETGGEVLSPLEGAISRTTAAKPVKSKDTSSTKESAGSSDMVVEVRGICIDCGKKVDGPSHGMTASPAIRGS